MEPEQEIGQGIENRLCLRMWRIGLCYGRQRSEVTVKRDEVVLAEQSPVSYLHCGDLFGGVDSQTAKPPGIEIGPHALAFSQDAVYCPVDKGKMTVAFDDDRQTVDREEFNRISPFVQSRALGKSEVGRQILYEGS